jgi:hypothetical protein
MTITPILAAEAADNLWTALPSVLWVGLIVACIILFHSHLASLLTHLTRRIRSGAAVKVGAVDLGAVRTTQQPSGGAVSTTVASPARQAGRDGVYAASRGFMLVHRLFRSDTDGQHYDVLIYIIPHKDASLIQVTRVEYFLGRFWYNRIFTASERSHGFALLASAYGPFLCTAEVFFTDGTSHTLSRYIDFEMGEYAPFLDTDDA